MDPIATSMRTRFVGQIARELKRCLPDPARVGPEAVVYGAILDRLIERSRADALSFPIDFGVDLRLGTDIVSPGGPPSLADRIADLATLLGSPESVPWYDGDAAPFCPDARDQILSLVSDLHRELESGDLEGVERALWAGSLCVDVLLGRNRGTGCGDLRRRLSESPGPPDVAFWIPGMAALSPSQDGRRVVVARRGRDDALLVRVDGPRPGPVPMRLMAFQSCDGWLLGRR